jgi:prevent-host-death family protein
MKEIPVTQARPKLSELVGKVARGKRYVIAQQGKRGAEKAVLVGLDEFEGMRRQMEFRQVFQDIRTQARASLEIRESLDDDAAMEAADRLVQEFRRERRARRS